MKMQIPTPGMLTQWIWSVERNFSTPGVFCRPSSVLQAHRPAGVTLGLSPAPPAHQGGGLALSTRTCRALEMVEGTEVGAVVRCTRDPVFRGIPRETIQVIYNPPWPRERRMGEEV